MRYGHGLAGFAEPPPNSGWPRRRSGVSAAASARLPARRRPPSVTVGTDDMSNADLNRITNFIWGIADDALRDLYVRGK